MRTLPGKPAVSSGRATTLAPSWRPIKRETVVRPLLILGLLLLLGSRAWADIQVKPQYDLNEPIVATVTVTDVPEGAKLRGSFSVTGGSYLSAGENVYHLWCGPGKHTLTAAGVWVLTQEVDVGGQKLPILVDFGQFSYSKDIVVGDGPDPPPPPPPPGTRWAVIWEETEQRNQHRGLGDLFLQLRKEFQNNRLLIKDVTDLPPSLRVLESQRPPNLQLPVLMVIARQQDGTDKVVRSVSLPSSVDAVKAEITK